MSLLQADFLLEMVGKGGTAPSYGEAEFGGLVCLVNKIIGK